MILAVIFILAVIGLDQLSKYWAVTRLAARGTIPIIENVFHLTYAENRGAAFSMMWDSRWFLVIITSLTMIFVATALYRKWLDGHIVRWGGYCIIAGGIGNLIDRVLNGYVVDMFDFRLINFAIFNVADIFICVGGGLFVLYMILELIAADKAKKAQEAAVIAEAQAEWAAKRAGSAQAPCGTEEAGETDSAEQEKPDAEA